MTLAEIAGLIFDIQREADSAFSKEERYCLGRIATRLADSLNFQQIEIASHLQSIERWKESQCSTDTISREVERNQTQLAWLRSLSEEWWVESVLNSTNYLLWLDAYICDVVEDDGRENIHRQMRKRYPEEFPFGYGKMLTGTWEIMKAAFADEPLIIDGRTY